MGGGQSRARGLTSRADGDRGGGEADDNKHNGYFILSFKEEKIKVNIALHCIACKIDNAKTVMQKQQSNRW